MPKHFSGGAKEWLLLLAAAAILFAALFFPLRFALALTPEEELLFSASQSGEILRIHIIANSDSPADQAVKLHVRDALIETFGQRLLQAGEQSFEAAYALLVAITDDMAQIARSTAENHGFSGCVQAETGFLFLPEKQYGSVLLPAGNYHALRITLGSGNGQNWWCVLYPQLCLALAESAAPIQQTFTLNARHIFFQLDAPCEMKGFPPVHTARNML